MKIDKFDILYVDDEQDNLDVFESTFWKDYNLHLANSGPEAIEILEKEKIHLIITDQRMPSMTGIEFLEKVIDRYPEPVRIILTGLSDVQTIMDSVNKGKVYHYITKPWRKEDISHVINNALETYTLKEENKLLLQKLQVSNAKLQNVNLDLEDKVKKRTAELAQKNEELAQALDHLKNAQSQLIHTEKLASLGLLSAAIGHEINNPLNYIQGAMEILNYNFQEIIPVLDALASIDPNQFSGKKFEILSGMIQKMDIEVKKRDIETIMRDMKTGTERTLNIVKSLRSFSRPDNDTFEEANVQDGIDSTLLLLKPKINKQAIEVERNYKAISGTIRCLPGQLNQVFMNVISNAIDAIVEKQIRLGHENFEGKIQIGTETIINNFIITVTDNGNGMSEEVKKRLFEPFYTTKGKELGNGLGMHISKDILQKHHGNIVIESKEGEGTKISLTIPIQKEN
ncbi:MAG: ATP-binding protein [Cyclobacteriaceae bacterium]|nr:ATP-binding protein [Cyclobacteriaceae bacterium]